MRQILEALTFHEDLGAFDSSSGNKVPTFTNRVHDPICGWDWYKAHYNAKIPEQSIEVYFDDKRLATVSTDMKYQKGLFKAITDAEISKHPNDFYKSKGKWNWLYIPTKEEIKQKDILLYGREFNSPIIAQATAIIEELTFKDMMLCVG